MDDMRAMMQDELRHALSGLLPPHAATVAPAVELVLAVVPPIAPSVMGDLPTNNDNAGEATNECC